MPAPRESASSPTAPVPAYRSSTSAPVRSIRPVRVLNNASRARSEVGRVPRPGTDSPRPRAVPPTIRIIAADSSTISSRECTCTRTPRSHPTLALSCLRRALRHDSSHVFSRYSARSASTSAATRAASADVRRGRGRPRRSLKPLPARRQSTVRHAATTGVAMSTGDRTAPCRGHHPLVAVRRRGGPVRIRRRSPRRHPVVGELGSRPARR